MMFHIMASNGSSSERNYTTPREHGRADRINALLMIVSRHLPYMTFMIRYAPGHCFCDFCLPKRYPMISHFLRKIIMTDPFSVVRQAHRICAAYYQQILPLIYATAQDMNTTFIT